MRDDIFELNHKPEGYYTHCRAEMLQFIPEDVTRVLDVGCGAGEFGRALKLQKNAEVWGIEVRKDAGDEAKTKLDNVLIGDIENDDISLPSLYFDCVVFNDVLEHLRCPWIVLRQLWANLRLRGYVVASIPNVRYYKNMKDLLINRQWRYVDEGILDKTHLRFFTIDSVKSVFQQCGYRVIRAEGINGAKFPWKFGLLNKLLLNALNDMRYLQFACVAQKIDE